ncbi:hypothetical protein, partial [Klebsiella pneumoniae]|uniref:hypothetical protein n=1 Tax=Klebsiella pneumoniae TaxID=573 RepID=UPI003567B805
TIVEEEIEEADVTEVKTEAAPAPAKPKAAPAAAPKTSDPGFGADVADSELDELLDGLDGV